MLDTLEYLQEKGKDDDLHKSYNDRSYLSTEEVRPGESHTGESDLPQTAGLSANKYTEFIMEDSNPPVLVSSSRFCGAIDRGDRLMVASGVQWCRQSSIHSDQKQSRLLHHVPEVQHTRPIRAVTPARFLCHNLSFC